jgi:hypothetical protein
MRLRLIRSGWLGVATAAAMLAGCGSVSEVTRERVARSETAVRQAQQTIGNSEAGALELQRGRDLLAQARAALDARKEQPALRLAREAELQAELAVAKSQTAASRKAADELQASIRTLRMEAERGSVSERP